MKWYVAKIIMQCLVGQDDAGPWTFEEQTRVIRAEDSDQAYAKAMQIGSKEEQEYQNCDEERVRWVFQGLLNLEELLEESIEDGTEITSRFCESFDASDLVRDKAELAVFWLERNKDKTAVELLAGRLSSNSKEKDDSGRRRALTKSEDQHGQSN